jgi:AcrR family transcriptional regulator
MENTTALSKFQQRCRKVKPAMPIPETITPRPAEPIIQRRFKCFDDTHQEMIETAVRLISEKGVDSLSISAVARALGMNRTTVYYHFDSREALLKAVKDWSSAQLAKAIKLHTPQHERIDYITRFVLENPELIKLWIEEFVSTGDIRNCYPYWDALVEGISTNLAGGDANETVDAEVLCVMLLTSTIIGPRVFRNRVSPGEGTDAVVQRFRKEQQRWLKQLGLLRA